MDQAYCLPYTLETDQILLQHIENLCDAVKDIRRLMEFERLSLASYPWGLRELAFDSVKNYISLRSNSRSRKMKP